MEENLLARADLIRVYEYLKVECSQSGERVLC